MDILCEKQDKCRACLAEYNATFLHWTAPFVTNNHEILTYMECFQKCTHLEVDAYDHLPQMLCVQCSSELRGAYEFIKKATESQLSLLKQEPLLRNAEKDGRAKETSFEWVSVQKTDGCENSVEVTYSIQSIKDEAFTSRVSLSPVKLTSNVDINIVKKCDSPSSIILNISPKLINSDFEHSEHSYALKEESTSSEKELKRVVRHQPKPNIKSLVECDVSPSPSEKHDSDSSYVPEKEPVRRTKHRPKNKDEEPKPTELQKFLCHICPLTFESRTKLKKHTLRHEKIRKRNYICEHCGKAFYDRISCIKHCKTHENAAEFKCKDCDKIFRSKRSLTKHIVIHTGDTFTCKICGKVLLTKCSYRNHFKTHEIDRKIFQCDKCEKNFKSKTTLALHMELHEGGVFRCNQCDKAYLYKESLNNHMLRHAGLNIRCEICGKGFPCNSELKSHMRIHSNEKPYKCEYCELTFKRVGTRNKHEQQHEGVVYKCEVCGKEYKSQPSYVTHKLTHMDLTMKCKICGKGFNNKYKMKRHISGVHKIELEKTEELIQKVKTKKEYRGYIIDPA